MKCSVCFKTCNKIEVKAFGQCGRCEAQEALDRRAWEGEE